MSTHTGSQSRPVSRSGLRPAPVRPVIGMVTFGPLMEVCEEQWLGVSDAAQANGCDVICFVGREEGHPDGRLRQANAVYDLISSDRIDAMVVWKTRVGMLLDDAELERFLDRFAPLPLVCVERQVAGRPTVLMDNRYVMAQAVSHLIEVHGHRRIAFVRGPDNHGGAQDRYQGYVDALTRHGLPVDPDRATPPAPWNWNPGRATETVGMMLDRKARRPDAIAAANDDLALGALSALEVAGIRIPDEVAVGGFDNHTNIRSHDLGYEVLTRGDQATSVRRRVNVNAGTIHLTTVRAPFHEMGRRAVEFALGLVRGEPVPLEAMTPTELLVRRSCGCFSGAYGSAAPAGRERPAPEPPAEPGAVAAEMRRVLAEVSPALPDGWAERLVAGFLDETTGRAEGTFLPLLAEDVQATVRAGGEPLAWLRALSGLRRLALSRVTDPAALTPAEDLWLRVQLLLAETTQRLADYRHLVEERRDQTIREAGQHLIAATDAPALARTLAGELPKIGIPGCYLASYEPGRPAGRYRTGSGAARAGAAPARVRGRCARRAGAGQPAVRLGAARPRRPAAPGRAVQHGGQAAVLQRRPARVRALPARAADRLDVHGIAGAAEHRPAPGAAHRARARGAGRGRGGAPQRGASPACRRAARLRSQALFSRNLHTRALQLAVEQDGHDPQGQLARGLAELCELTHGALTEMRSLIFQWRPDALGEEGLVPAIRRHAAAVAAREGFEVRIQAPDQPLPIDERAEQELFRVVQEALHNSVKHAHPNRVDIRLAEAEDAPGTLVLEVADDGDGFDPDLPRPGHLGLESMHERVQRLAGRFTIDSAPGTSTTIRAVVPDVLRRERADDTTPGYR